MKRALYFILLSLIISFSFAQETADESVVKTQVTDSEIIITLNIPAGMHQTYQEDMFYVDAESARRITFSPVIYPEGKEEHGVVNYYNSVKLRLPYTVDSSLAPDEREVKLLIGYQFCDEEGVCHFPEEEEIILSLNQASAEIETDKTETAKSQSGTAEGTLSFAEYEKELADFKVSDKAAGYYKSNDFIEFVENAKSGKSSSASGFAGMSIWLVLLLIIIGGIALNLTPCVLPMIPITIAVLGDGTQAESKGKGFLIGSLYGFGMMLAYGVLGLIVVLTGSQFGVINSSPWFNLIIAIIFIFLSLAMFDVIPIDFTKFQSSKIHGKKTSRGKYITVFILGVIAAVLAGACVAPVLISVILYSVTLYSAGNSAGLLLPFLLGLGMALPWPFVGAGLSILPKPGNWMKWIKIAFGVIILIIALYYGYTAYHIFASKPADVEHTTTESDSDLKWYKSLSKGLQVAREENKPVLIDFWATWCKNCLAMDATTFKDKNVQEAMQDYVLIKHQAEDLKISPHKELMEYFGILGLPTYIILHPVEEE